MNLPPDDRDQFEQLSRQDTERQMWEEWKRCHEELSKLILEEMERINKRYKELT